MAPSANFSPAFTPKVTALTPGNTLQVVFAEGEMKITQ
jgi:hypothetical protein